MKIYLVNRIYLLNKLYGAMISNVYCERIYTWLLDAKPINYEISDMNFNR